VTKPTCVIDECTSPNFARGWCTKHYARWRRLGDPLADLPSRTPRRWFYQAGTLNLREPCERGHIQDYTTLMETEDGQRACKRCRYEDRVARRSRPCGVDGCTNRRHDSSNYCAKHEARIRRHGDPDVVKYHLESSRADPNSWEDVLGVHVTKGADDQCWLWGWSKNQHGYGVLAFRGKSWYAHRVSYTLAVGPIPDDLTVDHICWVRNCVRPSHLQLLPHAENARRHKPKDDDASANVGAM
jgi:hypothetical protein